MRDRKWSVRYTKTEVSEVIVIASSRKEAKELAEKEQCARNISRKVRVAANIATEFQSRSNVCAPTTKQEARDAD